MQRIDSAQLDQVLGGAGCTQDPPLDPKTGLYGGAQYPYEHDHHQGLWERTPGGSCIYDPNDVAPPADK